MSKYGQFYRKPSLILFRTERVCPSVTNSQIHSLTLNVLFFFPYVIQNNGYGT